MNTPRPRILFIAAHLLYDVPNSGGDVLFQSLARHLAKQWVYGINVLFARGRELNRGWRQ